MLESDLCFITKQRQHIVKEKFIDGPPDLIIKVISESNRTHDTVVKFRHYAQYSVEEYWLVDPRDREISTWRLEGMCCPDIVNSLYRRAHTHGSDSNGT